MNEVEGPILFPIDMLNYDICLKCPELDIENHRVECFFGDKKTYENHLFCAHYERCRHLEKSLTPDSHEKHGL